ncbi:MAG: right-handed parallel beta-helix repeat-containing protein [Phycisphaerales bacterium]|nr:right-handed parallel beta-helix repeat-containing protein [Phycisphaerales bacterium]
MNTSRAHRAVLILVRTLALAGLAVAAPARAAVICVKHDAAGAATGATWSDAFPDLQAALAVAGPGDEIWVAGGTYTPGSDAAATFILRAGVEMYGGFAGVESARDQRDWAANPTVLSGDLNRDDVVGSGQFWYTTWARTEPNADHVVTGTGLDATTVLDGFTISDGAGGNGGGVLLTAASPTFRHCTFLHNLAGFAYGGGMYCDASSPVIEDCAFLENYTHEGQGGGLAVIGASQPVISGCVFRYNHAVASSLGTGHGGAIAIYDSGGAATQITVSRCTFEGNVARNFYAAGGGAKYGGAIENFSSVLTVLDCVFRSNTANQGGGIQTWKNLTLVNCLFTGNTAPGQEVGGGTAGGFGGAVSSISYQPNLTTIINCTISGNSSGEAGGVYSGQSHDTHIKNSIVWGNMATGEDVKPLAKQLIGASIIHYSCAQDLLTPIPGEDPPDPTKYPGSFDTNPMLTAPATGDCSLLSGSPCIDAGKNPFLPAGIAVDLPGHPRTLDDCLKTDTGVGPAPIVDIGACEFIAAPLVTSPPASLALAPASTAMFTVAALGRPTIGYRWRFEGADLVDGPSAGGGTVSGATTAALTITGVGPGDAGRYECVLTNSCGSVASAGAWLVVTPPACRADLNGDGQVDFADYLEFLNLYDAGDLRADFNGDGQVDFADYLEFLNFYDAGC